MRNKVEWYTDGDGLIITNQYGIEQFFHRELFSEQTKEYVINQLRCFLNCDYDFAKSTYNTLLRDTKITVELVFNEPK